MAQGSYSGCSLYSAPGVSWTTLVKPLCKYPDMFIYNNEPMYLGMQCKLVGEGALLLWVSCLLQVKSLQPPRGQDIICPLGFDNKWVMILICLVHINLMHYTVLLNISYQQRGRHT
eukprot:3947031-Pyramimonas_sp.AAC.1